MIKINGALSPFSYGSPGPQNQYTSGMHQTDLIKHYTTDSDLLNTTPPLPLCLQAYSPRVVQAGKTYLLGRTPNTFPG